MGHSLWGFQELDITKQLTHTHTDTHIGSWRKQGSFRKASTSVSLTILKLLTVEQNKLENS